MIVSANWLKDYINFNSSMEKLEEGLTGLGLECTIKTKDYGFSGVVVGKVLSNNKIKDSDHLNLCLVDIGNEKLEIVCGAPNVKEGIYVPVAIPGAILDNGNFKIKKTKIRGSTSNGMICSEKELGISDAHEGIMILKGDFNLGDNFIDSLDLDKDKAIEIDLTPNRGDCFSHLGVAREIAILENKKISIPKRNLHESSTHIDEKISIDIIDKDGCPRYACRILENVVVKESPKWLKDRLESIGQKSINNIVDAANYILFDQGHPMHTFDLNKISGSRVVVKKAEGKEKILCLDGVERTVDKEHLLIYDKNKPIAIAGIIGSENSCVDDSTTDILIESAYFDPITIRKGAKKLDLSTDASKRFERDTDIDNLIDSMNALCSLIQDISGGEVLKGVHDVYSNPKNNNKINFKLDSCNNLLGTNLTISTIKSIFNKLSIDFKESKELLECIIPSYRNDLEREVDLHEEVARVYGYDNIDYNQNFSSSYSCITPDKYSIIKKISFILYSRGFNEHYSNSLLSEDENNLFSLGMDVEIANPLSREMKYLRNSTIPGLLRTLSYNINHGNKSFKLFETGITHKKIKSKSKFKYVQENHLGIIWNYSESKDWKEKDKIDLYMVKGEISHLFSTIGISIEFNNIDNQLNVSCKGKTIGEILNLDNLKIKSFEKKPGIFLAQFNLDDIIKIINSKDKKKSKIPNQYPGVERDISFTISKKIKYEEIINTIKSVSSDLLKEVSLFDLYEDKNIEKSLHSLALSFLFKSNERTLVDNEIDSIIKNIIAILKKKYNIVQR